MKRYNRRAFFKATNFSKSGNVSYDTIKSYFEILYHKQAFWIQKCFHSNDLSQMRNLSAFKRILKLISKCGGLIGLSKINSFKLFQILVIQLFLIALKTSKMVLKWLFFPKKLQKLPNGKGLHPQDLIMITRSLAHNLHNQQLSKSLIQGFWINKRCNKKQLLPQNPFWL